LAAELGVPGLELKRLGIYFNCGGEYMALGWDFFVSVEGGLVVVVGKNWWDYVLSANWDLRSNRFDVDNN